MRVYVLGVGSANGAPIPISGTGDYMKDRSGNTVMSALNEDMCKQVAQAGGGAYIHVENNSAAQQQLDRELTNFPRKRPRQQSIVSLTNSFRLWAFLCCSF